MKTSEKQPFEPFITVDDILKFDPEREDTHTESRFVNALLKAIFKVGAASARKLARYMALDDRALNYGVKIAFGTGLSDFRRIVTIVTAAKMSAENPKTTLDDVAYAMGYANRASVWAILNDKKYAELVNRLCPNFLQHRYYETTSWAELARIARDAKGER